MKEDKTALVVVCSLIMVAVIMIVTLVVILIDGNESFNETQETVKVQAEFAETTDEETIETTDETTESSETEETSDVVEETEETEESTEPTTEEVESTTEEQTEQETEAVVETETEVITEEVTTEAEIESDAEEYTLVSLGTFRLTAYCNCSKCCGVWAGGATASGVMPRANHTIAVDTSVIPFGTEVMIYGNIYVAEDTGYLIDGNCIDIYFDDHQTAWDFGTQWTEVFKVVRN